MADIERRRRRLRPGHPGSPDGDSSLSPPERSAETADPYDPVPGQDGGGPTPVGNRATEDRESERGLRSLVGAGSSQLTLGAALRARDAARPTEADLAGAEKETILVRRNWLPRENLPRPPR